LYPLKKILESARWAEFTIWFLQLMNKLKFVKNIVKHRFLLSGISL
jgi:hypothetical protein